MGSKPAGTTQVQPIKVSTPPWTDLDDDEERELEDVHDDIPEVGDHRDDHRTGNKDVGERPWVNRTW